VLSLIASASIPNQLASREWLIGLGQLGIVRAKDVSEPSTLGLAESYDSVGDGGLDRAAAYLDELALTFDAFFQDHGVLLTPVLGEPPVRLGAQRPDVPFDTLLEQAQHYAGHTPPHNAAKTPAMSVPLTVYGTDYRLAATL